MLTAASDLQVVHMALSHGQSGLSEALSNESYDQWVSQYGMREKVACPANLREELKEPKVKCRFEIGNNRLVLTLGGIHRKQNIYSMLMLALCM